MKKNFFYKILSGFASDLSRNIRRPPAEGLRGVSGQFPPGHHCWFTRYVPCRYVIFVSSIPAFRQVVHMFFVFESRYYILFTISLGIVLLFYVVCIGPIFLWYLNRPGGTI